MQKKTATLQRVPHFGVEHLQGADVDHNLGRADDEVLGHQPEDAHGDRIGAVLQAQPAHLPQPHRFHYGRRHHGEC
jgi:hypothetical protein